MKNTLFMHILLVTDLLPLLSVPTTQPVRVSVKQTLRDFKKGRVHVKYFSTINYFLKQHMYLCTLWVEVIDLSVFEA